MNNIKLATLFLSFLLTFSAVVESAQETKGASLESKDPKAVQLLQYKADINLPVDELGETALQVNIPDMVEGVVQQGAAVELDWLDNDSESWFSEIGLKNFANRAKAVLNVASFAAVLVIGYRYLYGR